MKSSIRSKPRLSWACFAALSLSMPHWVCAEGIDLKSAAVLAEKGDAEAQYNLAHTYAKGDGVAQDESKAVELYQKAAAHGNAKAEAALGSMTFSGMGGLPVDEAEAYRHFRKAAEAGDSFGQYNTGWCLLRGRGTPQNLEEARKWYLKAAQQDQVDAQIVVGNMYFHGEHGMKQDQKESFKWFTLAAKSGKPAALNTLGVHYDYGLGVEKDEKKAVELYRKAADQGEKQAQVNLGRMYEQGLGGLKQDYKKATLCYALGVLQDEITAIKALDGLVQGLRITSEEKEEGLRMAEEYVRQHPQAAGN